MHGEFSRKNFDPMDPEFPSGTGIDNIGTFSLKIISLKKHHLIFFIFGLANKVWVNDIETTFKLSEELIEKSPLNKK